MGYQHLTCNTLITCTKYHTMLSGAYFGVFHWFRDSLVGVKPFSLKDYPTRPQTTDRARTGFGGKFQFYSYQ